MGWKDAPVLDEVAPPKWASAPLADAKTEESPPTADETQRLTGLRALAAHWTQEPTHRIVARYNAGERGRIDNTKGGKARPFASDAELLQSIRGTLPVSGSEAMARGMVHGATLGFAPEIAAGIGATKDALGGKPLGDSYRSRRDRIQAEVFDKARADQPGAFTTGDVLGGVATSFVPGVGIAKGATLAKTVGKTAALGAGMGLGNSRADLTQGEFGQAAVDTGIGAGVGGLFGAAGHGIGAGAQRVGQKIASKLSRAQTKAAEIGADVAEDVTRTARSQAGQDAQSLYRALEHVEALKAEGSPAALEKLAKLEADGTIKAIKQRLFELTVDELPEKLAKSQASRAAFREALETQTQRAAEATVQASTPSLAKDAGSLVKSYGEPLVADAVLGPTAGIVMGRTRAGKAIANRINKPGNQIAVLRRLQRIVGAPEGLGQGLEATASSNAGEVVRQLTTPRLRRVAQDDRKQPKLLTRALNAPEVDE